MNHEAVQRIVLKLETSAYPTARLILDAQMQSPHALPDCRAITAQAWAMAFSIAATNLRHRALPAGEVPTILPSRPTRYL